MDLLQEEKESSSQSSLSETESVQSDPDQISTYNDVDLAIMALESILEEKKIDWNEYSDKMIVVGSRALEKQCQDQKVEFYRECSDYDIVVSLPVMIKWLRQHESTLLNLNMTYNPAAPCIKIRLQVGNFNLYWCEFEIAHKIESSSAKLLQLNPSMFQESTIVPFLFKQKLLVVPMSVLIAFKKSHLYWKIHWHKSIEDYHFMCQRFPKSRAEFLENKEIQDFFKTRQGEVNFRFTGSTETPKNKNLDMKNESFFEKSERSIKRYVEHDFIHESVAFGDRPRFEQFKKDKSLAAMSRQMFESGSLKHQLECVQEEAMVIGLERYIFKDQALMWCMNRGKFSELEELLEEQVSLVVQMAYLNGLKRICTTLTSGWFREFAIENYPRLKFLPRDIGDIYRKILFPRLSENIKFKYEFEKTYDAVNFDFSNVFYILWKTNTPAKWYDDRRSIINHTNPPIVQI